SYDQFIQLKAYCEKSGILFLTTAFDLESLDFIIGLGVRYLKIPSGEITNLPYLEACARAKIPVILSTGMSDLEEVRFAVNTLQRCGAPEITLLHCSTEYPAPKNEVNLRAMLTMGNEFACNIGYSDHTEGMEISIAAVALGATVLEKHFTLDKKMIGPDHSASLEPEELSALITAVRNVEFAMGNGKKSVSIAEEKNKAIARKSIVASTKIKQGEIFTEGNLSCKRPGNGISPIKWYDVIGKEAKRDYEEDELIVL
ncbi:MAG: neuB, partial [Clostridia bacterium]|nr:neuB [Clostridia bacterium]